MASRISNKENQSTIVFPKKYLTLWSKKIYLLNCRSETLIHFKVVSLGQLLLSVFLPVLEEDLILLEDLITRMNGVQLDRRVLHVIS